MAVTDRTILDTPAGPVRLPHTIELEPVTTGTVVHMRFGAPRTRREQVLAKQIGAAYGEALRSTLPGLVAQLDAELAAREAGRGPEPELPGPRPDGLLNRPSPLPIVD